MTSIFTRIHRAVVSRVDSLVEQIQDHDAVAGQAVAETQAAVGRLGFRIQCLQAEQRKLEDRLAELRADAARWRERALKLAATDETQALACLGRAKAADAEHQKLQPNQAQQAQFIERLLADYQEMQARLMTLRGRRYSLAAREALADASAGGAGAAPGVEELFLRWENRLAERCPPDLTTPLDPLARKLEAAEEEAALRAELAALRLNAPESRG